MATQPTITVARPRARWMSSERHRLEQVDVEHVEEQRSLPEHDQRSRRRELPERGEHREHERQRDRGVPGARWILAEAETALP